MTKVPSRKRQRAGDTALWAKHMDTGPWPRSPRSPPAPALPSLGRGLTYLPCPRGALRGCDDVRGGHPVGLAGPACPRAWGEWGEWVGSVLLGQSSGQTPSEVLLAWASHPPRGPEPWPLGPLRERAPPGGRGRGPPLTSADSRDDPHAEPNTPSFQNYIFHFCSISGRCTLQRHAEARG